MNVQKELNRRIEMWQNLLRRVGTPENVEASLLRDLKFFAGQQGIYRDLTNTKDLSSVGVTLSVLHIGKRYADDISDTEIIYHYPETQRTGNTDLNEIEATKNAGRLGLPLFVISATNHNKRNVKVGRIEKWDDRSKTFLISFVDHPYEMPITQENSENIDSQPFQTIQNERNGKKRTTITSRPGQQKFKFEVIKRYGPRCAICDIEVYHLLQAAHIVPVHNHGSDDPRNGIVLCANHHLAFDYGLFTIKPYTYEIEVKQFSAQSLGITRNDINHLTKKPHDEALMWRMNNYKIL
jgi:putative restriction endonuclease